MKIFNDSTTKIIEKSLNTASLRQEVLANNLANVNTPRFKRSAVEFESILQKAISEKGGMPLVRTHPKHFPTKSTLDEIKPQVVLDNSTTMRADGNNVDVDQEMVYLAQNSIMYNTLIELKNGKSEMLRSVIRGGR